MLRRHLAGEHRHHDTTPAQANTRHNSPDKERRARVRIHRLYDRPDDEYHRADDQTPFPAPAVRDGPDGEAGDEGAELLQGDGERGDSGCVGFGVGVVGHEGFEGEDAADYAAVVAD